MRNTAIAPTNIRQAGARLTFRDNHLRFRKFPNTDSETYNTGTWHDAAPYGTGFLRVCSYFHAGIWTLAYQYVDSPNAFTNPLSNHWEPFTDSGIQLEPWSTVAVEDGRIFYQAAAGGLYYVDFNGAGLGAPVHFSSLASKPVALAPVSRTEIYVQIKNAPADTYSRITLLRLGSTSIPWSGRLYGSPDYLSGFDAVRCDGRDRIYFTDELGQRTLYMTRPVGSAVYSDVRQLIPLDVVDETSSFVVGGASVINGKVFLSGVLKRDGTFPMHIFTYEVRAADFAAEDHYSLGREMFIRSGQTREGTVTFDGSLIPSFPMPSGKLILVGDVLWYVAFGGSYYAYATQLVGVDREEFKLQTSAISGLSISSASNQATVLQTDLSTSIQSAMIRAGCEVDAEIGYSGQLAQIGKFDINLGSDGADETGKTKGIVAQSYAMKRLAQWEPDANFDYWSQTKVGANPADLTKLIRQSGQWSGSSSIRLDKLNVDGFLYAVDRPSRNHLVRARFKFPSDPSGLSVYSPEFGVCLNYFSDSDVGTNAIVAYYAAGKVYIKLLRGDDFIATLGSVDVTAGPNTYYWLAAEFHDCQIRVYWGTINTPHKNISWNEILTVTFQELIAPWKREDFIGRGGLYVKNVTPHSMGYPFTSTELIVPVEDNADFPLNIHNRFVIVDNEIIEYNGKSWPTRQVDLKPALGDAIVGNVNTDTLLFDVPIAMRDTVQWSAGIQTFLLPANYFVNGVKIWLRKLPGETDDLTIAIYQGPRDNKRPVGVKIASCNIANDAIGEDYSWIVGNFGTPMFLNKTNRYWVVVHQSNNPGDPTNPGFEWALSTDPWGSVQGAGYVFNEDADDWVAQDGDFLFALMGSTSVNAWTIILENLTPPTYMCNGQTYTDAARYNDMALIVTSGAGVNEMFKVTGYGGMTDAGNHIVFVDRDPANVVGEDSIFVLAPTLKVKTRGATYPGGLSSTATFHGRAMVSLYRPLSPECDLFRYYSSEKDMRLEDIIAELAAKAGVVAYSDKEMPELQTFDLAHQYSPTVTGRNSIVRFKLPSGPDAQPKILFRAAAIDGANEPTSGYEVGLYLDPADTIGAWLTDNKVGVVLDSVTISLPSGQRDLSNAWVTVSIFEEHVSIWLDGYFLWSFNLKDYDPNRPDGDGLANAFSLLWTVGSVEVALDWSQCDQLRDNYIFDMGQNGMSLLSDLVKERRIFFQDDAYGRLRLLRNRVSVVNEDGAPYNLAALSSSNHNDSEFASRIRLVGAEIAEGYDRTALAEYGNVFRLKYSQMLDYEEEHKEEVQRALVDAAASRETHNLVGAFDPRLEVNDVISVLVDGRNAYRLAIDSMGVHMGLGPEEATCDMQIEAHLHIPYDGGSDIIISSVGHAVDWTAGNEDPDAGERNILLYRASGGVKEYPRTPAGLVAAAAAVRWNDTIFVPPGEIHFTVPTELLIPYGVSLTGAGKTSTILSGTVTLQVWHSGSISDLAIESTTGKLWNGGGAIYYLVYANGGHSTLRSCRLSLAVSGRHAAAYLNHGGASVLQETDISVKASGNVGQIPADGACIENLTAFGAVRVYGGELVSSEQVIGTQQHPPMPSEILVKPGAVKISGAIQVENT